VFVCVGDDLGNIGHGGIVKNAGGDCTCRKDGGKRRP
jgi:hypothetical protein